MAAERGQGWKQERPTPGPGVGRELPIYQLRRRNTRRRRVKDYQRIKRRLGFMFVSPYSVVQSVDRVFRPDSWRIPLLVFPSGAGLFAASEHTPSTRPPPRSARPAVWMDVQNVRDSGFGAEA